MNFLLQLWSTDLNVAAPKYPNEVTLLIFFHLMDAIVLISLPALPRKNISVIHEDQSQ